MYKNCTRLETVVNEKIGHFYCDSDTPIAVAKEMVFQFQKHIGMIEDHIRAQEEKKKESESSLEPDKVADQV